MTSANGKIPAGSTFVSITDLGMIAERAEESMGLTKCPDKNAKIVFRSHTNELLETLLDFKIPLYIISGGISDSIYNSIYSLQKKNYPNISIHSNEL